MSEPEVGDDATTWVDPVTAPAKRSHYADDARPALVAELEKAGLESGSATAWAQAMSANTLRYEVASIVSQVIEFDTAGFVPADGIPYLEAGFNPTQAREATDVFGRTVADLRRLCAIADEAVRVQFDPGEYYVFDRAQVQAEVMTLMCSAIPIHQADVLLSTGASALWAVWTHAECERDNDPERWTTEMFLVALGAAPEAPANPPEWWDQWRNDHGDGNQPGPREATEREATESDRNRP